MLKVQPLPKTYYPLIFLMVTQVLKIFGIELDPAQQEALTTLLLSLAAIFLGSNDIKTQNPKESVTPSNTSYSKENEGEK